jgi:hypothetical protein
VRNYWVWPFTVLLVGAAWLRFGWQGALFALSFGSFLLLMQFSRTLRVLRDASRAPIGHVGSAVMLNSRLRPGMRLADVLRLTGSLGEALVRAEPTAAVNVNESFRWRDPGGITVDVELAGGRVVSWSMQRPDEPAAADMAA